MKDHTDLFETLMKDLTKPTPLQIFDITNNVAYWEMLVSIQYLVYCLRKDTQSYI